MHNVFRYSFKSLFLSMLIYLSSTLGFLSGFVYAYDWQQIPLRSQNQKNAGLQGGEGMQMILSIAYAPSNPNVVYLVSDVSQVWKSVDAGKTWKMIHKGFYANGGLSIMVDPLNENIAFVAGTIGYPIDRYQPTNPLNGIFRTRDGGETWQLVKETGYFKKEDGESGGTYFAFVRSVLDRTQTKTIYAGTYNGGLLKSTNAGSSWTSCGLTGVNIFDIKINPKDPSVVFVASLQGLYKYNDKTRRAIKIGNLPDYPRTIVINPQNPNIIYAAVGTYGVYWSNDSGATFTKKSNGLPTGKEYVHISLSPANPNYLYVSINKNADHRLNPFYSQDGGANWYGPTTIDQGNLALFAGEQRYFSAPVEPHPKNANIAFTAANGKARILKTIDGGKTWAYSADGYTGARMGVGRTSLAFSRDTNKMIFFLTDHGPALTEDNCSTFKILKVVPTFVHFTSNPVGALSDASNTIVAAIGRWDKQLLEVSRDNGNSWQVVSGTEDSYRFIAVHPQKTNVIYAQGFKSNNSGTSWVRLPKKVYAMFRGDGDVVYSVSANAQGKAVIDRSNDGGQTWTVSYPALPIAIGAINEIDVDPNNPDRIYVATNFGIGIYDNKAKTWVVRNDNNGLAKDYFGLTAIKSIVVDPRHPEVVYAGKYAPGKGQSNGVFRSTDYGMTWQNITNNLQDPITAWSISVSPYDGTVYVGSSHGTWKLPPPYSTDIKLNATFFFSQPAETK